MNSFYSEEELKNLGLASYGENVLISRNAAIYGAKNMIVGNNVRIDDFCILSGKIQIGNNVHIAAGVYIFAGEEGVILNDFSGVSSRCAIYAASDDYTGNYMTNPTVPDKYRKVTGGTIYIGRHSLVGTGCTILPGIKIGDGASIGAMSLINKDIEEYTMNVGIPCKKIKERSKEMLEYEKEYLLERKNTRSL